VRRSETTWEQMWEDCLIYQDLFLCPVPPPLPPGDSKKLGPSPLANMKERKNRYVSPSLSLGGSEQSEI